MYFVWDFVTQLYKNAKQAILCLLSKPLATIENLAFKFPCYVQDTSAFKDIWGGILGDSISVSFDIQCSPLLSLTHNMAFFCAKK